MKNKKDILKEAISLLENKQAKELKLLKEEFHTTYESLKPLNLVKNTLHQVEASPEIKKDILTNTIELATNYLSKKVLTNPVHAPIKKVLGSILQLAMANILDKHSETITNSGENLLKRIFSNGRLKQGLN